MASSGGNTPHPESSGSSGERSEPHSGDAVTVPQSIEDVIKSLVGFSQVVSKSLCALQGTISNLTTTVEGQAAEIAQLRKMLKSAADTSFGPASDLEMKSDTRGPNEIDESEEECAALLNKMQMRRDALKNTAPTEGKKDSIVGAAKTTILAAAKHLAAANP